GAPSTRPVEDILQARDALAVAEVDAPELAGVHGLDRTIVASAGHAFQRYIVDHHDLVVAREPHVELASVRAFVERQLEGRQGVFGRGVTRAAMAEQERPLGGVALPLAALAPSSD